ncbi:Type II secretory pathway ATPase GspE/PulE or T4P pilus assembly pathway ATPase PilB (PulE) [Eupransor demetentiae]|uniref:Type II secretory pathway ATPase GspE/PulE or T4P pilus assembly pathway ATPase PilB (PulE) n=1 Tax=Eupransor demetentiae TaxID=3109584 RepID=A0ABM9N2Y8_9LACO|nr:Type II secretory pathway ATPase GspE/PulE or T4P pilus assembly pathway ATPase PilB (PulE) [Lactobacillaceae bacterium LMG 33000]
MALRHRPDVLVIGEIRDAQTAKAAVQAALSGHLVLSTVHALSARNVTSRLLELGVNAGQLQAAFRGAAYQRLLSKEDGQQAALLDFYLPNEATEVPTNLSWDQSLTAAYQGKEISKVTYEKYQAIEQESAS